MTDLTTEQLQTMQAKADSTLDVIIESREGSTELQAAVRCVMQASDDALSTFQRLAAGESAVTNQQLFTVAKLPVPNPLRNDSRASRFPKS